MVATIQSTGAAQSTIKLVATNLIANGNVWEGVQLLCLIGKGLDACRYLISYGLWEAAVWLAKSVLPLSEMHEVMRKWSDHLWASGHKVSIIKQQHYKMCKDTTKTFVFCCALPQGLMCHFIIVLTVMNIIITVILYYTTLYYTVLHGAESFLRS